MVGQWRSATLRDVVPAAAAAAQRTRRGHDERARLEAARPASVVNRYHHRRPPVRGSDRHDDARPVRRDPAADVQRHLPDLIGGHAVGNAVGDKGGTAEVLGAVGFLGRVAEQLCGLQPVQVALGVAQPGDDPGNAIRQLLPPRFELLGQLAHQDALPGQIPERVDAYQRLDPPDP